MVASLAARAVFAARPRLFHCDHPNCCLRRLRRSEADRLRCVWPIKFDLKPSARQDRFPQWTSSSECAH